MSRVKFNCLSVLTLVKRFLTEIMKSSLLQWAWVCILQICGVRSILFHHFRPFSRGVCRVLILGISWHHFKSGSTNLLSMECTHRPLRRLLGRILGIAARLPVQEINVNQTSESPKHVLEGVQGRRRGGAHDEQTLSNNRVHRGQGLGPGQLD